MTRSRLGRFQLGSLWPSALVLAGCQDLGIQDTASLFVPSLPTIRDRRSRGGVRDYLQRQKKSFALSLSMPYALKNRERVECFTILIGRSFIDPDDTAQKIFFRLMKPLSRVMLEMLGEALPEFHREASFWRYQFVIGALARTMRIYKNPKFESLNVTPETDVDSLIDSLISFAVAGMETPIGKNSLLHNPLFIKKSYVTKKQL